ncbi:hypothetical protein [Novosphingobium sp. 9U]|uniref:hypothetical protein n=1 Tax=Novosphingobium sp. 9U TaxID=2653158 RepID=UPI0012F1D7AA|nr:hypothetical protein [Novosphingobium sp. 9U]VWX47975.1 hypothetical protein NOVOSPHI9U_100004 [Novosphingobium sp. 9U]
MYKSASNFMQAAGRRAAENSQASRVRAYQPRTRAETRKWWYSVIEHHYRTNTSARDHYGKRYPAWLEQEVQSFGAERWLAYWGKKTGKPKRVKSEATTAPQAKDDGVLKSAAKKRREEQGRRHYEALILERRSQVSPLASALHEALRCKPDS